MAAKKKLAWFRATKNEFGRTVYASKCGRYRATRMVWSVPTSSVSYVLEGAGGTRGQIDCETLAAAKECAQDHADEPDANARHLRLEAIHKFRADIVRAIQAYDKSNDHCAHAAISDCMRCNAAAAVNYTVPPRKRVS